MSQLPMKQVRLAQFCCACLLFIFITPRITAQVFTNEPLQLNAIPADGMLLNIGWKIKTGDSSAWAAKDFDDAGWRGTDPTDEAISFKPKLGTKICWLRLDLTLDSNLIGQPLVLRIQQNAASEIFLDGRKVISYGKLSENPADIMGYNPINQPLAIPLDFSRAHVIAVRMCMPKYITNYAFPELSNSLFRANIYNRTKYQQQSVEKFHNNYGLSLFKASMFILLLLLHCAFYFLYKKEEVNLYLSFVDISSAFAYLLYGLLIFKIHDIQLSNILKPVGTLSFTASFWFLIMAYYNGFNYKKGLLYKIMFVLMFVTMGLYFSSWNSLFPKIFNPQMLLYPVLSIAQCLWISLRSLKKTKTGKINPFAPLMIVCLSCVLSSVIANVLNGINLGKFSGILHFIFNAWIFALPIAVLIYIAIEFGYYYQKLLKAQALRNKIALDLHDDLGSKLTTVRIFLKNIGSIREENEKMILANSIKLLDTSLNDMRQIMSELQTSALMENGYIAATEELINKINHLQQINFTLTHSGLAKRFEQKTEYNLFRITQEMINNTLKYANAKSVSLDLVIRDKKIIFMYEDDGIGFSLSSASGGFGLKNIVSRSQSLGGSAEFDTSPGAGFRSIIELPLKYA